MERIRIEGGIPLKGTVRIQGSKNAALPIMAAALLQEECCVLRHCPKIADVFCMEAILNHLGIKTQWDQDNLYLDCSHIRSTEVLQYYTNKMRSSVILMSPLLARMNEVSIGYPGGCTIGERPIDLHLEILRRMGASVEEREHLLEVKASRMEGAVIEFPKRSVGATEQGILAAVRARGRTVLRNCACEPEIVWLSAFLREMGAEIKGEGTSEIEIKGDCTLRGCSFEIPPDRIVAGTYLCASAITRGRIILEDFPTGELEAFLEVYRKIGGQYQVVGGKLVADSQRVDVCIPYLQTEVYPGFPTDLQSPLMAVLTTISGKSHLRETIFEDRFKAALELNRMGANIQLMGADAVIYGGNPLRGTVVGAQELRGGAALVLAGLAATGVTYVENCEYIDRGYEQICSDLAALGGNIERDTGKKIYESIKLSKENR